MPCQMDANHRLTLHGSLTLRSVDLRASVPRTAGQEEIQGKGMVLTEGTALWIIKTNGFIKVDSPGSGFGLWGCGCKETDQRFEVWPN